MKTIQELMADAKVKLKAAHIPSWEIDARLLTQAALQLSHEKLLLNYNKQIESSEELTLITFVARRLQHEPVSRILGTRHFWKSEFQVSRETLDPRPDSETLIEAALEYPPSFPARLLDCGTGTGCLLLSLLQEWPAATGIGLDISAGAIDVAAENARSLGLDDRAQFVATDWGKFSPDTLFDVIISNPPYIAEEEKADLAPEVVLYDPAVALFGGRDGLEAYRGLIPLIFQWLKPEGVILLEIGHTQANSVKELLARAGFDMIQTRHDLAGSDRVIIAKKP